LPTYPFQRYRHYIEPNDLESKPRFPLKLYEPGWTAAEIDWDQVRTDDRPWLVFADTCGVADGVIARLSRDGGQSCVLYPGETFQLLREGHYTIRPANREDLGTVLSEIKERHAGAVPRVVHLWSVTGGAGEHNTVEAFNESTRRGSHTLTALIMAANDTSLCDGLDIAVVADAWTQRDQERLAIHAEKGGLIGPLRCIPHEFPQVTIRAVDLPELDGGGAPEWVCDRVYDEVRCGVSTWTVLLRPEARYVEAMYAAPDIPLSRFRLRERGVVLISGGVGGLGLVAARSLFDAVGARIALTSRWTPPDRSTWDEEATRDDKVGIALREVLALEAAGAEVMIVVGDMADYDQVSRMVDEVEARWGAVHGVVHAAGIVGPALVMDSTPERLEPLFLPKVHGAFHLERRLRNA
jgi:acyl transferase domain-containing protein